MKPIAVTIPLPWQYVKMSHIEAEELLRILQENTLF